MTDDHLKALRDSLIRCCNDYTADQAIRALASALTTIIIGGTRDRASAHEALDRLVKVMRAHVEEVARPAGSPPHYRAEPRDYWAGLGAGFGVRADLSTIFTERSCRNRPTQCMRELPVAYSPDRDCHEQSKAPDASNVEGCNKRPRAKRARGSVLTESPFAVNLDFPGSGKLCLLASQ